MGRFDALSDLDFEELVADLLSAETGLAFRAGTRGPDGGIDVLANDAAGSHVVQCKHVRTGSISQLLSQVRKEARSLEARPWHHASYRFVTSTRLSHAKREEIAELLDPWVTSAEDVFGEGDLADLLRKHPNVEARHVKLWLPGAGALRRVIHAGAYVRTDALVEETRTALPRYVQTRAFLEARRRLHAHGVCVVAGPPGVGKTTLARLLMLDGLEQGFAPYDIPQGGLREAWDLLSDDEHQLFFYDDFLGRISLAQGQEDDEQLLRFMRRVAKSPTTRIVLTTREYILRQAQRLSEVLDRESSDLHRFLLHVEDYDDLEKARILYNHIYFSNQVDETARRSLVRNRGYRRIINHEGYSPRLIEWMTGIVGGALTDADRGDYAAYCLGVLDRPEQLWQRAVDRGLEDADRALLLCLASLPDRVTYEPLEAAFIRACAVRGLPSDGQRFIASLKVLHDSFITSYGVGVDTFFTPLNPSLLDFLADYVRSSRADARRLLEGALYLDQVLWAWETLTQDDALPPEDLLADFSAAFAATLDTFLLNSYVDRHGSYPRELPLYSPTDRLGLMCKYADRTPALAPHLKRWLPGYAEQWLEGVSRRALLPPDVRILSSLDRLGVVDATQELHLLKPKVFAAPQARRWPLVGEILLTVPSLFDEDDLSRLRSELVSYCNQVLDDAPAYFEEVIEVEELQDIASQLDLSLDAEIFEEAIEALEEFAASQEGPGYEDYDDDRYDDDREFFASDDDAIDGMFDRLLED